MNTLQFRKFFINGARSVLGNPSVDAKFLLVSNIHANRVVKMAC
jgi:hypothetical protein